METSITVTMEKRGRSTRTAAGSPSIAKLGPWEPATRHSALGEAARVVRWLNATKGTASNERVVLIRRELEELPSEFATHTDAYVHSSGGVLRLGEPPPGKRRDWPKEKLKVQRKLHDRHVALNRSLENYVFRPRATYIVLGRAWMFGLVPDEIDRGLMMCIGNETISEADAVMSMIRLAESGDLQKVRLCDLCKVRWRVAAKRNYRFCSDQCREIFYAQSTDYHSRKAANQRKYRENLKRSQAAQGTFWMGKQACPEK